MRRALRKRRVFDFVPSYLNATTTVWLQADLCAREGSPCSLMHCQGLHQNWYLKAPRTPRPLKVAQQCLHWSVTAWPRIWACASVTRADLGRTGTEKGDCPWCRTPRAGCYRAERLARESLVHSDCCMTVLSFEKWACCWARTGFQRPQMCSTQRDAAGTSEKIHLPHIGLESALRFSREVVFWPEFNSQLKDLIQKCEVCCSLHAKAASWVTTTPPSSRKTWGGYRSGPVFPGD